MIMEEGEWEPVTIETESIDWLGNPITLRDVRAERNKETGRILVDPTELTRVEMEQLASELRLEGRDLPFLLICYASPGPFQPGYVHHKSRLNKMLFHVWKRLELKGLGEALPHDEFGRGRAGPIPRHLKEDMKRLEGKDLLAVQWGRRPGESTISQLTEEGLQLGRELWKRVPGDFIEIAHQVKEELFPLDSKTIKDDVHRDFPEYRATYVEEDRE